eukprot:TRINITY_DN14680_c0_g1_i1.p1 TRINITY_DN14680_c0_g1~~TRINITY_DN14680_c0_g1_i1.p1  ORF type:complete len:301 (+),score=57.39 TRINITY_DN14680_c0_g1_i1:46-948(+)
MTALSSVDCIVKLGGSALTIKSQFETLNFNSINALGSLLQQTISDFKNHHDREMRLIIVHGAGSFGHFQAKQFKVTEGIKGPDGTVREDRVTQLKQGVVQTRISVTKLNHIVVTALAQKGLPVIGCSPCANWKIETQYHEDGKKVLVLQDNVSEIESLLCSGFIPVLHGDAMLDSNPHQMATILSGDVIMRHLAVKFNCTRTVFISDVEGICTAPPTDPTSCLIRQIDVTADGHYEMKLETSQLECDVTGGILGKIKAAINIILAVPRVRVYFCSSLNPESKNHNLIGTKQIGTVMLLKE